MGLEWLSGIKLIGKAREEKEKAKLWEIWLSKYPQMDKQTYISFDDFVKQSIQKATDQTKSKEDIFAKAKLIKSKDKALQKGV